MYFRALKWLPWREKKVENRQNGQRAALFWNLFQPLLCFLPVNPVPCCPCSGAQLRKPFKKTQKLAVNNLNRHCFTDLFSEFTWTGPTSFRLTSSLIFCPVLCKYTKQKLNIFLETNAAWTLNGLIYIILLMIIMRISWDKLR